MKEFEIVCPLGREPRLKEIEAKAAGMEWVLKKRSIDSRKEPVWRYQYEAYSPSDGYRPYELPPYMDVHDAPGVIVVGAGPAGMFAALKLLTLGLKPIVLERGKDVQTRKFDMARLSREGIVNPDSNYCYGEGGAGAFSDGKLYTRSTKRGDVREVLHQLVAFGASADILVDSHPHIGSDKLPGIVEKIRGCVVEHGGEYHFDSRVEAVSGEPMKMTVRTSDGTEYSGIAVILATGHSARDVYEMLLSAGGALEAKGFAMGVRVEHPQEKINWCQYHGQWKPGVPAAEYSFVEQVDGRGVFSFCMCPGGILVPSSTQAGTIVLNGMSNSGRSGRFANAGVVVQIEPEDVPGDDPFRLMDFQHEVEKRMYDYSRSALVAATGAHSGKGKKKKEEAVAVSPGCSPDNLMVAPAQRMEDFCLGKLSKTIPETSYHPGAVSAPLHELLPPMVSDRLRKVFPRVKMRNYYTNAALLLGVESRTSSPVRIPRDPETLQYVSFAGIYPCGEGAGYSGGIVSSAIDGINVASAVADNLRR
ncbi:MAG: NAD(P)/FAD-dependent oxidoreductase [Bacteroidales bacterium]|nr:NAD(P)/FAD-dependent oxidoreductase [Bacteroidales bacterium]